LMLVLIVSCDEPETVVTDIVHPDGSVTRKIEMKSVENKFKVSDVQVPYDSTWIIRDSVEIVDKKDTVFVRRAEKLFASIYELNRDYLADSSVNNSVKRRAEFRKRFKWFNTEYRYAEVVEKVLTYGYPVSDYLDDEELNWFYSPDYLAHEKLNGPDSLKYRAFSDTVDKKIEEWTYKSLVSELTGRFRQLSSSKAGSDLVADTLKSREDELMRIIRNNDKEFDSLWSNGIVLRELIGEENALKYKDEADSAMKITEKIYPPDFTNYTQRIVMPGEIIGTNGFIDSTKTLSWPVHSDFFMTEPYIMYSESKISNKWAWIVSGVFLIFVLAGVVFRNVRRHNP
jgi:hypothetical protein